MTVMRLEGISQEIAGTLLYGNVDLSIESGDRLGIIGVNGCGKSTFLKMLAGVSQADSGKRILTSDCRVGYLAQLPDLDPELSVAEAVYSSQVDALRVWGEYQQVCARVAGEATPADLKRLDVLSEELDKSGFYQLQTRADIAMQQLGLFERDKKVSTLSGGQRRRVALAQELTRQPDLLLLDEPTNHLDTDSIEWLEGYLKQYAGALVVVTHDRYFLDRVTQKTLEIDQGVVTCYQGSYERYVEKKSELDKLAEASADKRANLWRRELAWLRRGPRARATKSKSRIERAEELRPQNEEKQGKLQIETLSQRLGKKILELNGVSKAYGERTLLRKFSYQLDAGARIGVIGPNGAGKTTLLDLMSGKLTPDEGTVERGTTVRVGYFDQDSRELDGDIKVLDSLREVGESIPLADGTTITASQMLERFLFPGRLQHTKVERLSGGERRRLYLLQVLMSNPNLLFLDEPTNDLDIPTLSCLEDYLDSFAGCLIVSSHDRYFLDRTVESLLAFEGGMAPRVVLGGYSDYLQSGARASHAPPAAVTPVKAPLPPVVVAAATKSAKLSFKEKRELEQLEKDMETGEVRKAELEAILEAQASNYEVVKKAFAELDSLKARLETDMERWAELAERAN